MLIPTMAPVEISYLYTAQGDVSGMKSQGQTVAVKNSQVNQKPAQPILYKFMAVISFNVNWIIKELAIVH